MGLSKATADCSICKLGGKFIPEFEDIFLGEPPTSSSFPAWSLHRLIEMYHKTCIFWIDCGDNPYEAMVCRIADKIRRGEFNEEYLEEL